MERSWFRADYSSYDIFYVKNLIVFYIVFFFR